MFGFGNSPPTGRSTPIPTAETHFLNGRPLLGALPDGIETITFAMGCFWGVERIFWQLDGVYLTAVGYAGGQTPNATYKEVCSGKTGHTEVVKVDFDPSIISLDTLLQTFWEGHDPTQGMRQGNDVGTQYRSAIYTSTDAQMAAVIASRGAFQANLSKAGFGPITTEIVPSGPFFYAEDYHQQYLEKNPDGYCGIGGTGVTCPIGWNTEA